MTQFRLLLVESVAERAARGDAELGEDPCQVGGHRAGGEEELRGDLLVRQPGRGEAGDGGFLRRQPFGTGNGAARGVELALCSIDPRRGAEVAERIERRRELGSSLCG